MKPTNALLALGIVAASTVVQAGILVDMSNHFQNVIQNGLHSPRRLVQTGEFEEPQWMTEVQVLELMQNGIKFMDITDDVDDANPLGTQMVQNRFEVSLPSKPLYHDEVTSYYKSLDTTYMAETLTEFTKFHTRYYKSSWGAKSCRWLIQRIREIAAPAGDRVTVKEFEHDWDQFSIIARFEGTNESLSNELVIVSAHQDSVNLWLPSYGRSPGADDDGSGTVSVLEGFRNLIKNGFSPERPVEFHWYSGEEAGLLGSQAVAKEYNKRGIQVTAMLQNDMTGYIGAHGEVIGIVTDYVNEQLTDFLKALVDEYASIPYVETKCGYACSDHASWRKYGYPSAFTIESRFEDSNQFIHTTGDVIEKLSIDHMKEFSKVAIAFAVELSHA